MTEIVVELADPAPPIVVTLEAPPAVISVEVAEVGLTGPVGPTGPQGPGADAPTGMLAGHILSGHRLVVPAPGDTVVYADHGNPSDLGRPVWLTTAAAVQGSSAILAAYGLVTESSWAWSLGPIYVGANGLMVQTPPATGYSRQIGTAVDTDTIWLDPQPGIALT